MKRLKKLIIILVIMFLLMGIKSVKGASLDTTVTKSYVDNIWSFHYRNGRVFSYGQLKQNYTNGKLAYCIQPETSINFSNYNSYDDWGISGYSDEAKRKMELYAYYGYGFDGHDSIEYYMATQELIWRLSKDEDIVWHTGDNSSTPIIDISYEKNEILRLADTYGRMPSYNNSNNSTYVNKEIVLTDHNNVYEGFDIVTDLEYKKNGNQLIFNIDKMGSYEILIKPKKHGYDKTIVYDREDSPTQDLATFKMPDLQEGRFKINVTKTTVNIYKRDKETNELIKDLGNKVLINDTEYEFTNGVISLRLGEGIYTVKEINSSNGYYINNEELKFTVESDSGVKDIDFYNERIKGKVDIKKINEDGELLSNVKFELYDDTGKKIDEIITTEKEYDSSIILPLGRYTLKEVKTLNGYELDNKTYNVSLINDNNVDPIISRKIEIINKKILCEITFISSDELGKKVSTSYEVYDKDMNVIYKGNTTNGEAKLSLTYGKYYIKETGIENGYILNDELKEFEVSDDFCLTSLTITNKETIYPKTSTKYEMWPLLIILLDILGVIYVKKNN